ncbi:MAG: T9SS type A sorting domain-containing protein [Bacteroidia bacterium]
MLPCTGYLKFSMFRTPPLVYILCLFAFLLSGSLNAQDWVKKMQDPSVNFYDVQQSFNKYWSKKEKKEKLKKLFRFKQEIEEENEGYIFYKRWEYFTEQRVFPSGDRSLIQTGTEQAQQLLTSHAYKSAMQAGGGWVPVGAFDVPANGGGAGRLNCIRFHPTNPNIIFVGSPSGGLWKTTDGGLTWSTNTDALPTLGITDIAIDPVNTNVMYLATGDGFGSDTYGVGVLKSTNGGASWNLTGLSWTTIQGRTVNRVLIHPDDSNILFASASNGIYKSTNAGLNWTKVSSASNVKDLELKPGDPSTVYAVSASNFYKSTNTGSSFSIVNTGLPQSTTVGRIAIAVTAAEPSYVYLLYTDDIEFGFKGLYRSTDSGNSFVLQSDSPNLIGYASDGQDSGGNGWYTLSIAASPTSQNEIVVGGVNIWKSFDGGVSWSITAHWYGDNGTPYVHADIHDLIYRPDGNTCYAGTDGGIFSTSDGGSTWQDHSNGLQIGQMYRQGGSVTNPGLILQGWQDNGTNLHNAGNWSSVLGGDGMECFIDWSDPNYMYAEFQNGELHRSSDGGLNFDYIVNNIDESGEWITPWCQDPVDPSTIYAGFKNVWKSTDKGDTWTAISSFNSSGLTCLAVSKSNPLYIYASNGSTIYKTVDGGSNWTTISPPGSNTLTYIAVSETNPDKLWITYSGYTANKKVYYTTDGGTTWTNLSGNLPNIPANCIVNQNGTNDGVYVGTDVGVYYRDAGMASWIPFSNGLPNVVIDELEIHYGTSKLRAATYGRGLWESDIYNPTSNLPFASFAADSLSGCPGLTVHFSDSTLNNPTSWQWTFPGGTPATSTQQNPTVVYNTPGTFHDVKLVVTNINGVDSVSKYSYIAISQGAVPTITLNNNDSLCQGQNVALTASTGNTYKWYPTNQASQTINSSVTNTYSVTVTDALGCAVTSQPVNIFVFPNPAVPTVTINGDTLVSSSVTGNQWYLNGSPISGATGQTHVMQGNIGAYKVEVTDSIGLCTASSQNINVGIEEHTNGISYVVFPNPSNGITHIVLETSLQEDLSIEITDAVGKKMSARTYPFFTGSMETSFDMSVYPKGVYTLTIRNSRGSAVKKIIRY